MNTVIARLLKQEMLENFMERTAYIEEGNSNEEG